MDDLTRLAIDAAGGDRWALDQFVRRSQADVWRLCAALGGRAHADDLTQEAYLRAFGALPRFRADASARTWLLTITRNTCADFVRRQVRHRRLVDRLTKLERPTVSVDDRSTGLALDEAVATLDPDRRAAFVLTQTLGLSYADAAAVCSCPVGTIRSRVARAREDLLAAMSDGGTAAADG